ncbi:MAG: hypothetical protein AAB532_02040 [Patescibacteria group bacterium]
MDNTNDPNQKVQPQTLITPSIGKEVERPVSDFVVHSEKPPVLDKEMEAVGIKTVSDNPVLTVDHQQIGVKPSLESTVPNLEPKITIEPLDQREAQGVVNKYKNSLDLTEHVEQAYFLPSIFGFATLILKNLRKVHGKIMGREVV